MREISPVFALALAAACAGPSTSAPPAPAPTPAASAPPPAAGKPAKKGASLEAAKKKAQAGDLAGAAADAEKAIAEAPGDAEGYLLLASLQGMQDDAKSSRATLDRGAAQIPRSWQIQHAIGMSALEAGDVAGATSALEQARALLGKEKNAELAADLAYAYLFAKRTEDAERLAKEARELEPRAFPAAFTHGEALLRLGRFKEAASAYKTAADIQPDDPLPRARLATSLMKANDYAGAAGVLEKLVAQKPDDAGLSAALAQCLIETSRPKDAIPHAERALAANPNEASLRELLAVAQEQSGDKAAAKKTRGGAPKGKKQ